MQHTNPTPVESAGTGDHPVVIGEPTSLAFPDHAPLNNIVCGVLVFSSHWLTPVAAGGANSNLFACGIAIVAIAMASLVAHGQVARNYWSGLNVVVGLWLVFSATVFPLPAGMWWAQMCLGVLTMTIALTSVVNECSTTSRTPR